MEITPQDFRDVRRLVRSLCGLVLTDDKTYLVRTRLETVVQSHGCATFTEYLGRLQHSNAFAMRDELVEALTTGETSFNRDAHPFEEFRRLILPAFADTVRRAERHSTSLARVWSAGCSTGQEPYSVAMAIRDYIAANAAQNLRHDQFPILATDVSNASLTFAREGRYSERDLIRGVPAEWRNRYFRQDGGFWTIAEEIRRSIEFRRLNFIDRVGNLGPFEVIFCRNVMIYFDNPTRQRLCDQFHQLLAPGGILILGAVESLYGLNTSFQSEQIGATTVFRKPAP